MIGFLKGQIIVIDVNKVILSASGIGYEVFVGDETSSVIKLGGIEELFVVQKISEYGEAIYGFKTYEEKRIFETLENIKGIGAKNIFTIISFFNIKSISDLGMLTVDEIVKVPGVGKSTAQKFLLGVSNILKKDFDLNSSKESSHIEKVYISEIHALVNLGLSKREAFEIIKREEDAIKNMSTESRLKYLIKNSLK